MKQSTKINSRITQRRRRKEKLWFQKKIKQWKHLGYSTRAIETSFYKLRQSWKVKD